jgi:hypothetical protein
MNDVWELRDAARGAEAEVASHHTAIAGMTFMAQAQLELDRHEIALDADLGHIRWHLRDMQWNCSDWDLNRLWSVIDQLQERFDTYVSDTATMGDMASLRLVCDDYAADMASLFDTLDRRLDSMWCW